MGILSDDFLGGEIRRVEEKLLDFCPYRATQDFTITLPDTADTTFELAHQLTVPNNNGEGAYNRIRWEVVQSAHPVIVYRSVEDDWAPGLVKLRATSAGGAIRIRLSVDERDLSDLIPGSGVEVEDTRIGQLSNLTAYESWVDSGIRFNSNDSSPYGNYDLGIRNNGPTDYSLILTDRRNNFSPLLVRYFGGNAYHVQPGPSSKGAGMAAYLGNPSDSFNGGYWNGLYVVSGGVIETGFSSGMGMWTAFTPTWTQATTNPTLGNGTLTGRYTRIGNTIHFDLRLVLGSTTTLGTGNFIFTLPTNIYGAFVTTVRPTHVGTAFDSSAGTYYGCNGIVSGANTIQVVEVGTNAMLTQAAPFAWANGDTFQITGTYEAA